MTLIDGKAIAQKTHAESKAAIAELKARGVTPGLAVVLIGDDPASRAYVRSKDKMCHDLGMHSVKHELPATATQAEVLALVHKLNADSAIHGILVQSPPPPQIDERAIVEAIDPRKDVDGFHPISVAKLALGDADGFVPCTPLGCQRLLIESGIETAGANVVVLGRSMIVGKPMALLLMNKGRGGDATVTVAHSRTRNPRVRLRRGGYPHRRDRQAGVREGGFCERRRGGDRCGHQPRGSARLAQGLQDRRRCGFRRGGAEVSRHHARARWGWTNDHCDADVEHDRELLAVGGSLK